MKAALLLAVSKGYRINAEGFVYNPKGVLVKGFVAGTTGYRHFGIKVSGQTISVMFHRLQAYQKYGDKMFAPGIEVRHLDSVRLNNSDGNIAIGTHKQNMMDIPKQKRLASAYHATSFFKKHDHEAIKAHYAEHGFGKTMSHFGISSKGTMSYIINH